MLTVIVCLLSILTFVCSVKDPLDFDKETCVKIFYSKENTYTIYCLSYLDNQETLGFITDHNDTIIFKKIPDLTDESKICVNVHTVQSSEKYCMVAIPSNCLAVDEDPKKAGYVKMLDNTPCKEVPLEETQVSCIGFSNHDFTLVFHCAPVIFYLRRTVFYVPDNKPPKRE